MSSKGSADPAGRGPSRPDTSTCRLHFRGVNDGTPLSRRGSGGLARARLHAAFGRIRGGSLRMGGGYANAPRAVLTGEVPFGPRGPAEMAVRNTGPDQRARLGHVVPKQVKNGEKLRLFSF